REASRWLGTPYRYGGTERSGVDCSGFTWRLYRAVAGIALPRVAAQQALCGVAVPRTALRPGDLLFFGAPRRGIQHVGLSLGGDVFVHASVSRGVTYETLRTPYYASRFAGARRVTVQP
ncbi:MAG: hypothetical protein FJ387_24755, partial [Verrucomicrobia bacterium]|nr:hypothetical protein [Verrucomicrobiota bacterium]